MRMVDVNRVHRVFEVHLQTHALVQSLLDVDVGSRLLPCIVVTGSELFYVIVSDCLETSVIFQVVGKLRQATDAPQRP